MGESMAIEADRERIPALEEKELIQLDETRLSKLAKTVNTTTGVLGAGLLTFLGLNNDTLEAQGPGLVLFGAGVLLAVSLLAWAIVSAADIRARGAAAAANLALRARPNLTIAAPGAAGSSAGLWVHIAGRESADKHLVIDSREVAGKTEFLLARSDEKPAWSSIADIDSWDVKTG